MSQVEWYGDKVFEAYSTEVNKRVLQTAFKIEREAKKSLGTSTAGIMGALKAGTISSSAIKGSKKLRRTKSGKFHLASLQGHPPNVDTGRMRAAISTNHSNSAMPRGRVGPKAKGGDGIGKPISTENNFVAVVGLNLDYPRFLELGTSKMAARPWLRPAFEKIVRSAKSFILRPVNR